MLFIMFCEFFYLLGWATVGVRCAGEHLPEIFGSIPWLALGALVFFALWVLYFRGSSQRAAACATAVRSCTPFARRVRGSTSS